MQNQVVQWVSRPEIVEQLRKSKPHASWESLGPNLL
jgi:hypothetical protein